VLILHSILNQSRLWVIFTIADGVACNCAKGRQTIAWQTMAPAQLRGGC